MTLHTPLPPLPDLISALEQHTALLMRALRCADPCYLEHLQNRQYVLEHIRAWSCVRPPRAIEPALLNRLLSCVDTGRHVMAEAQRLRSDVRTQLDSLSQQLNLARALALQTESSYAALELNA